MVGILDSGKGALALGRKTHTPEQVINKLREAEVELARGMKVPEVCRKLGIAEYTYYRWRKEYGGLRLDQARRFKDLERENARLKKLVADLSLDNAILREAAQGNF
jgi:putative transposase